MKKLNGLDIAPTSMERSKVRDFRMEKNTDIVNIKNADIVIRAIDSHTFAIKIMLDGIMAANFKLTSIAPITVHYHDQKKK